MGIRIAKFENDETWVVYQSTSGVCFEPMFYDCLSAWLYARHYGTIGRNHEDWDHEKQVGDTVQRFIRTLYEEQPDDHPDYIDVLATVTSNGGTKVLDALHEAFMEWRKDRTRRPMFKIPTEEN
jgi:hypothetical protein